MQVFDEIVVRALSRLSTDNDFKVFMGWVEEEKVALMKPLLSSLNISLVHQLQGSTQILTDIQRAVMSAQETVAANARNRNT